MQLSPTRMIDVVACSGGTGSAVDDVVDSVLRGRTAWAVQGSRLTITKDGVGALTYARP
jgi:hypothetical protein